MLSVQSPLQLAMSTDNVYEDANAAWNAWRSHHTNLPTPPSSDPPRRLGPIKQHFALDNSHGHGQQNSISSSGVEPGRQQLLTLPPIAHIDRHWPSSSPLTPPDDEMHISPVPAATWRDTKPGSSCLHSPMTSAASPFLASPSPSPVDEYERYEDRYERMDDQSEMENEIKNRDRSWDWQQQGQRTEDSGMEVQNGSEDSGQDERPTQLSVPEGSAEGSSSAADWITNPSQLSAHFIAEKTCEMVCYLWFSSSLGPRAAAASRVRREHERAQRRRVRDASPYPHSPPFASRPLSNASTAALQFSASSEFITFMEKLLTTTQVSQSVIVLSLHYIYRLKETNEFTVGKPGSEFRVAVCALMLANKFVDDNTYTNKTWSEVSGIALEELNKMEREFLLGVNFQLFVDAQTYDSWLNLLKGLVLTKERELNRWRERRRTRVIVPRIRIPNSSDYSRQTDRQQQQRARSTSPHHPRNYSYAPAYPFTFSVPSSSAVHLQGSSHAQSQSAHCSPNRPISSKRTAADAFSPTSATFAGSARGGKRPTGLALDIPAALASATSTTGYAKRAGSVSAYPSYTYADSLRKLETMSLATPTESQSNSDAREASTAAETRESREQTLAAPYRGVDAARRPPPPHLYFYSLASSPLVPSYAAVAAPAAPESEQPCDSYVSPVESIAPEIEGALMPTKTVDVFPAGADRKARLRYMDSHGNAGYTYAYGYAQGATQALYNAGHYNAYPAPTSDTSHRPSETSPPSIQSTSFDRPHYAPAATYCPPHSSQQTHQLPPLILALSMHHPPIRSSVAQTQSDRASPLPGFASLNAYTSPHSQNYAQSRPVEHTRSPYDAQVFPANTVSSQSTTSGGYLAAPKPAPVVECAWSAPPSETVNGLYAPVPRHVQPHGAVIPRQYSQPQNSAPVMYGAYASPTYTYSSGQYTRESMAAEPAVPAQTCSCHEDTLPERATFANAGPPGVAHFYPYVRSGASQGAGGYRNAYPAYSNTGKAVHQSHSTTASPEGSYTYGYDYCRGRRL